MGVVGEKVEIEFVISTGDNFYEDGLTGVHDPAFNESFINIYTPPSLHKQWYNGNFHSGFLTFLFHNFTILIVFFFFLIMCLFLWQFWGTTTTGET